VIRVLLAVCVAGTAWAQSPAELLTRGEKIFNQTCATGYCHSLKGGSGGGAPRLVARGFSEAYINDVTTRGVPGTAMPAFGSVLSRLEFASVVAYVASLNGLTPSAYGGPPRETPSRPSLSTEAAHGREFFFEAARSYGRCATCHQVSGVGIPVASPIDRIPADAAALRALSTPAVKTAVMNGEGMPALVISRGKANTVFFDLTSAPPVQRTAETGAVKINDGSAWKHAVAISAYSDAELNSILAFLRAAIKP
jgi:mono/diheme cytochrome c family protein